MPFNKAILGLLKQCIILDNASVILSEAVCHPERSEGSHSLGRDASVHSA